ncbi:MAG TPA: acyl-CoA dehydrogenase family protein [Candidatus Dormibacteraeota bacterium]|nr:acyl-CoA dehydrogenase family protein [Candidatus Dormibacteraeota bacterium]
MPVNPRRPQPELALTPAQEAFRDEVRDFLGRVAPKQWLEPGWRPPSDVKERLAFQREWDGKLRDAGLVGMHWPAEYGGRGASLLEQAILEEELAWCGAPQAGLTFVGLNLVGPTLIAHGSPAQKTRHLPAILASEEVWCQGFSEPNAGSDLASVRTRAAVDGDALVINGQKVWTSYAHAADFCMLLCRTNPEERRSRGLSLVIVDMHAPGVEVRPLRQATGESEFNEVFLTDVRISRADVIGDIDDGWRVAMTTLLHERGTALLGIQVRQRQLVDRLIARVKTMERDGRPLAQDPMVRQALARASIECDVVRHLGYRCLETAIRTGLPGAEGSAAKIFLSDFIRRFSRTALDIAGAAGLDMGEEDWGHQYLGSFALSIGAGTTQIQKNILAEHLLGLPRG